MDFDCGWAAFSLELGWWWIWTCEVVVMVMLEEDMILIQQPTNNIVINNTPHYSNKIGRKCEQRSVSLGVRIIDHAHPLACALSSWIWVQSTHHVVHCLKEMYFANWENEATLGGTQATFMNSYIAINPSCPRCIISSVFLDFTHDTTVRLRVQAVASAAAQLSSRDDSNDRHIITSSLWIWSVTLVLQIEIVVVNLAKYLLICRK